MKLVRRVTFDNMWSRSTLVKLDEKVSSKFVEETGEETNEIKSDVDEDGHQHISFFLKTVESCNGVVQQSLQTHPTTCATMVKMIQLCKMLIVSNKD